VVATPGVRAPRVWLQALGVYLPCIEGEAKVQKQKGSSTYSAVVPFDAAIANGLTLQTLSDEPTIWGGLYITADVTSAGPSIVMSGPINEIEFDFESQILQFQGQDNSKSMHDTKNHEKFLNQTSSQIVNTIAGRHGLTAQIDSTVGMVGRQWRSDFAKLTDGMSDWSLVQQLALIENCRCYVKGMTLVFTAKQGSQYPINYTPPTAESFATGDFIQLKAHRNLQAGKSQTVKSSAWDTKKKVVVTSTKTLVGSGGSILFEYRGANMKQAQVEKQSTNLAMTHGRHEFHLDIDMPGDTAIDISMQVVLSGTQTDLDQAYEIDTINHIVGDEGYRMSIDCKSARSGRTIQDGGNASADPDALSNPAQAAGMGGGGGAGGGS
jgi:phage protein D